MEAALHVAIHNSEQRLNITSDISMTDAISASIQKDLHIIHRNRDHQQSLHVEKRVSNASPVLKASGY